jgi:hypothetical protein
LRENILTFAMLRPRIIRFVQHYETECMYKFRKLCHHPAFLSSHVDGATFAPFRYGMVPQTEITAQPRLSGGSRISISLEQHSAGPAKPSQAKPAPSETRSGGHECRTDCNKQNHVFLSFFLSVNFSSPACVLTAHCCSGQGLECFMRHRRAA